MNILIATSITACLVFTYLVARNLNKGGGESLHPMALMPFMMIGAFIVRISIMATPPEYQLITGLLIAPFLIGFNGGAVIHVLFSKSKNSDDLPHAVTT